MKTIDTLPPQSRQVYDLLKSGQSLTSRTSLIDYGVMSLSRRICDLKDVGIRVNSVMERNKFTKQRYARYTLAS